MTENVTDTTPALFDRLADRYDQIIPFFAAFAGQMDVHRLDLPDASYDLATGGFVIHLVAERQRVLAGLRRVLRPGGRVALTTPGPCEDHGRWNTWNSLRGEFAQYLRAAGFADIRTVSLEVHLPVTDPQTCWDFHMSHGFAGLVEALDPADAAEFGGGR